MKKFLNKIILIILLIIHPTLLFSAQPKIIKSGFSKELFKVSIQEVKKDFNFGDLIDVYYPSEVMPCFIFVFKNENYIFEVLANSENWSYIRFSEMNLSEYIALGFLKISNLETNKTGDFFFTGKEKKFEFLSKIGQYTSIVDIEKKLNMELVKIDKGGFLFPFYTFIYKKDNHILEVICSPNADKNKCYFVGGWTYH